MHLRVSGGLRRYLWGCAISRAVCSVGVGRKRGLGPEPLSWVRRYARVGVCVVHVHCGGILPGGVANKEGCSNNCVMRGRLDTMREPRAPSGSGSFPKREGMYYILFVRRPPVAAPDRESEELAMSVETTGSPPTSPWWTPETPLTLARRGTGKEAKRGLSGGWSRRSGRRSCTIAATPGVFLKHRPD